MQRPALRFAAIAILGVVGIAPVPCLAEQPESGSVSTGTADDNVIEEFDVSRDGDFLFLPVTIDGTEQRFLVDTGCTGCILDNGLKSRLIPTKRSVLLSGKARIPVYELPDVLVGTSRLQVNGDAVCTDLKAFRELRGVEFQGILGMSFLKGYVVRIDFDAGKLSLLKSCPEAPADGLALTWHAWKLPELTMELCTENRSPFIIDTGMIGGKIAFTIKRAIFADVVNEGALTVDGTSQSMTIHGITEFRSGQLDRTRVGNFEHAALKVDEGDRSTLGLEYLSRYIVTFDFPNTRIFLEPGKRFREQQPCDMSGLILSRVANETVIYRVYKGSPADAAGLKVNERVIQIDDKHCRDFTIFGLEALLNEEGRVVRLLVQGDDEARGVELRLADWQKARRLEGAADGPRNSGQARTISDR